MSGTDALVNDAKSLMQRALRYYDPAYGFGTMSSAPYDTAWVALVSKSIDGKQEWLFPECFEYLLATQSSSGGWTDTAGDAKIDGILNTAGPLLAFKRHAANPLQLTHDTQLLEDRIAKATASLQAQLAAWDVSTTDHVGFEIIVPAILELLRKEDETLVFRFDAEVPLMKIHHAKMSRFRPEYLYGKHRMTALHSLESFIGKINFDRVAHHKINGSMLGSPSSTAAYLMNKSTWDDESEAYLRTVIKYAAGQNTGAVPSAFPSTYFEITWMLSTLFRAGYTPAELESPELTQMTEILLDAFQQEGGVVGFAPHFEPDVDDSAKTITCLSQLDQSATPKKLIEVFEAETHFRTYAGERDPSLTANCNALLALLESDVAGCSSQILKVTKFLCDYWWASDGKIKDKWNTSYLYPSILLVEALTSVLEAIEAEKLPGVFDKDTISRLAITLFQACFRPLLDQKTNGSWNDSIEETAYGILILSESRRLKFFEDHLEPIGDAIKRGVAFVNSSKDSQEDRIWIEKVSYSSPVLTQSYLLAALRLAETRVTPSIGTTIWDRSYAKGLHKHVELFGQAPLFSHLPRWELHGSMVESALFATLLRSHREDVFDREHLEDDDSYFDVIPFFWTSSNNRARTHASTNFLYEVSRIALMNFQVDEFMEATAGPKFEGRFDELRTLIRAMLADDQPLPIVPTRASPTNASGTEKGVNGHKEMLIDERPLTIGSTEEANGTSNGNDATNDTNGVKEINGNGISGQQEAMVIDNEPVVIAPAEAANGANGHRTNGTRTLNGHSDANGKDDTSSQDSMLIDERPLPIAPIQETANGVKGTGGIKAENGVKQTKTHEDKADALDLSNRDAGYVQVFTHLSRFLNYILQHKNVKTASAWDQKHLRRELRTYLLAHTQQAEDSLRSGLKQQTVSTTTTTFFNWVRTTSADHISCPYSFAFISCFMGSTLTPRGGGTDCFPSAEEKYLANALCRHLATMCRMYNDLGSTERDHAEGNLNSIDFPEFDSYKDMKGKQKALLNLGNFEREAYFDVFARLGKARLALADEGIDAEAARLGSRRMEIWSMFCEQVDLYGQVYVVRDISSRVLAAEEAEKAARS